MLTVVDKPLIQYATEEAVAAGMDILVVVVGRTKNAKACDWKYGGANRAHLNILIIND